MPWEVSVLLLLLLSVPEVNIHWNSRTKHIYMKSTYRWSLIKIHMQLTLWQIHHIHNKSTDFRGKEIKNWKSLKTMKRHWYERKSNNNKKITKNQKKTILSLDRFFFVERNINAENRRKSTKISKHLIKTEIPHREWI